jgi:hypothetical protein
MHGRRGECTSSLLSSQASGGAQAMARREKDDRVGGGVLELLPESSRPGLE